MTIHQALTFSLLLVLPTDAIFGKALLGALEMHLGDQWTAESISSWENLVKDIASSMQEGATCEATQLVQRTWKAVEEQGLEENGVRLFRGVKGKRRQVVASATDISLSLMHAKRL